MKIKQGTDCLHLVVDCRMINAAGIGTYLKNILAGIINAKKFDITVMGYKDELETFTWFTDVRFICLHSKILSWKEQLELPLKIPKCDIYWAPNVNGAIFPTRARKRMTTFHDVYHLANPHLFSALKMAFLRLLIRSALFYSQKIVTVSEFSKREIIKYTGCKPEKVCVSPLAVDDDFASNYKFSKIGFRYILFVGNVKPHKNLEKALEAFEKLAEPGLKFVIVGKREGFITGYSSSDNMIRQLGDKVLFTGFIVDAELKNFYANAAALIFPSKYEGFGLPVLEAMKFNIPVIASFAASIPEVGGDAITYFDPDDTEDIQRKMTLVLAKDHVVNSNRYMERLASFNWKRTIFQHIEVLFEL